MFKLTLTHLTLFVALFITFTADAQILRGIFGGGQQQQPAPEQAPAPVEQVPAPVDVDADFPPEEVNTIAGENDVKAPPSANWYEVDRAQGQNPRNVRPNGNNFSMTVGPGQEAVKIHSKKKYTNGRFTVRAKSASVMPGIITAIYLASGEGRTNDVDLGDQDELDFEFLGNHPNEVQTNIFVNGQESLRWLPIANHAQQFHEYTLEWDAQHIAFYIDNEQVRYQQLYAPLKPMNLVISVWTTTGGWPGLIQWGGATNWGYRGNQPAVAEFEVMELPN